MPTSDASDPTWNLAQLFVWFLTRNEGLVAKYADQLPKAAELSKSLLSRLASSDIAADCGRAHRVILRVLGDGRLTATGLANNKGRTKRVPAGHWAALQFFADDMAAYARPKEGADRNTTSWHELRFSARQAMTIWTLEYAQRETQTALALLISPRQGTKYPTDAQFAQRKARWRRACGSIPPAAIKDLAPDRLPDDPDTTATAALSWMTVGVAIPLPAWRLFDAADERLAEYGAIRFAENYNWRRYREAHRTYLVERLDPGSPDTPYRHSEAAIANRLAVEGFVEQAKKRQTAAALYAEAAAAELCIFDAIARASGLIDRDAQWSWFVNRIQDTERLLFKVIREEALVLRGRRSGAIEWEIIPADHIRLPVHLNLHTNSLEPSGDGSMEDYKAIRESMPGWVDLRFRTSEIRANANRLGSLRSESGAGLQESPALKARTVRGETICRQWLADLMRNERQPSRSKAAYRADGRERFGISWRAFDRAWDLAIEDSGNTNWSQSGPRNSKRRFETPNSS